LSFPVYNAFVGGGVAIGFLVGDAALRGRPERSAWPYLCLLALGCGAVGAVWFSYYAGVTESWQRPAFTFLGGAAAALVALVLCSRVAGLDTLPILDAGALGICAGHALGRLGCVFGGCCYGRVFNLAPAMDWSFRFPSPLVESGVEVAILLYLRRSACAFAGKPGLLAARWMILYGVARFALEFARGDFRGAVPFNSGGMSPSQCLSVALVALGASGHFMIVRGRKAVVAS
jgi:phosphatidylglycerol---prolipoprotein diacylglyceryl transferase